MLLQRLEALPVGSFHYKLLFITGLGWLFDSMDTGLIAFVLPVIGKQWGLAASQMGAIGSIGLVGMAIGAIIAGGIADRFGRKTVFSATVILYSIATGLCAISWNFESLLIFRFLVGFGLGGELPVAATLMSEFAPTNLRGRFIVLLESFWGVGWIAAACIAYMFIPVYGWHYAFIIGALPAVYVFFIRLHMPESVRYLLSKGRVSEAQKIVNDLEEKLGVVYNGDFNSDAKAAVAETQEAKRDSKVGLKDLWSTKYLSRTIMLWIVWFGIVYSYYGIFTWLPSIVYQQGFAFVKTFEYVLIITFAQLPGYFCAAWLVDKWGRKYTLSFFLLMSGVASYFFGQAATVETIVFWGCVMSFFNLGAWGVVYTYTPELYPTAIRAMGSGWAAGIGRIGGMAAPLIVGLMIQSGSDMHAVFYMFAAVFIIIALAVFSLGVETKKKNLENI